MELKSPNRRLDVMVSLQNHICTEKEEAKRILNEMLEEKLNAAAVGRCVVVLWIQRVRI